MIDEEKLKSTLKEMIVWSVDAPEVKKMLNRMIDDVIIKDEITDEDIRYNHQMDVMK